MFLQFLDSIWTLSPSHVAVRISWVKSSSGQACPSRCHNNDRVSAEASGRPQHTSRNSANGTTSATNATTILPTARGKYLATIFGRPDLASDLLYSVITATVPSTTKMFLIRDHELAH